MQLIRSLILAGALCLASCATKDTAPEAPVTFKLIAINDFHGQLRPPTSGTRLNSDGKTVTLPTGGAAYLATLVEQLKSQNALNAVVAAGDLVGASPLDSALFHDEPSVEALGEMGLEITSVGNHEFDEGIEELKRLQAGGCHSGPAEETCRRSQFAGAKFTYLAANVLDATTGKPVLPASKIKTFTLPSGRKLQVGFIGAVLEGTPEIVMASGIRNLKFVNEADAVNAAIPALRKEGAQVIVLLIHEGASTTQTNFDDRTCPGASGKILPIVDRLDPAVSVIVSGHTHNTYICNRNGRLLTSAGSQGRFVTDIDVSVEARTGKVTAASARQIAVVNDTFANPLPDRYPTLVANASIQSLVEFYGKAAAPLTERPIAEITADITRELSPSGESSLGRLITDAQLAATSRPEDGGAQIAFMNNAGIRSDLSSRRGRVTFGEIHSVHPFGNSIITGTLTGAQIHALLEQQWQGGVGVLQVSNGFTYEWSADAPPGSKVKPDSIRLNGTVIERTKTYRVTMNEFIADGGDGFKVFLQATDRHRGVLDVEALEKYIAAHSPIAPPPPGRISRK